MESVDFKELEIELDKGQVGNSEYNPQAILMTEKNDPLRHALVAGEKRGGGNLTVLSTKYEKKLGLVGAQYGALLREGVCNTPLHSKRSHERQCYFAANVDVTFCRPPFSLYSSS